MASLHALPIALCVLAAAAETSQVVIHAGQSTHEVNPLYMGCHSDTGYTHQGRGFSSQLLFGESFESAPNEPQTWQQTVLEKTAQASVNVTTGGLHAQKALHISYVSGNGFAGLANRGLGNEGLFLQKGKPYEGFFWVQTTAAAKLQVGLYDYSDTPPPPQPEGNVYEKLSTGKTCEAEDNIKVPCGSCGPNWGDLTKCKDLCEHYDECSYITYFEDRGCRLYKKCDSPSDDLNKVVTDIYKRTNPVPVPIRPVVEAGWVLADQRIDVRGSPDWQKVLFTLTPTSDASCEGIAPGSDPRVDCGGMGPAAGHICVRCAGQFAIGLAAPGDVRIDFVWLQPGKWGRLADLPVLKDTIDTLQSIGITSIRQGGSFTDPAYYFWKNWRGPLEQRPSVGATWGRELISSWGPFEMIDMCEAAGFEPIITTTGETGGCCAPDDMADLVEYCWGNSSTKWGSMRVSDGHPDPYRLRFIELGNEQYNTKYVDQVAAMEERAKSVGMGGKLYYISPNNNNWIHADDAVKAEALGLKDHLLEDFHVGSGGAVPGSEAMFKVNTSWNMGSLNLETNAGIHTMNRALMEASDLNDFFNQFIPPTSDDKIGRIKARTASFCTERSGHYDAFDQGITFFLPNGSWIQPPGYVHKMIHDTWLSDAVHVDCPSGLSCSSQRAPDGSQLRLLVANTAKVGHTDLTVLIQGLTVAPDIMVTSMSSSELNAANPPGQPALISPFTSRLSLKTNGSLALPAQSFTVIQYQSAPEAVMAEMLI